MTGDGSRSRPVHYMVVLLLVAAVFISYLDRSSISVAAIAMQGQFGWSQTQKGLVLSSFFVGYMLLMLVSGVLANRYGGKIVLGCAVLWWSLMTLLTPPAATMSLAALVIARIALGAGEAAVIPASINMIGRWVPPLQRSRATALLISAAPLSTAVSLPLTGWLVHVSGWPVPFYAFGVLGLLWVAIWFTRVDGGHDVRPTVADATPGIVPQAPKTASRTTMTPRDPPHRRARDLDSHVRPCVTDASLAPCIICAPFESCGARY